ncbi:MAG: ABC transporter ATP-binding protein, partial [Halalkalicoccus sp.]
MKLFNMKGEIYRVFERAVDTFADSSIALERNEAAIDNFYQFIVATAVFVMIYAALVYSSLSLGALGVFLFAMFRLAPRVSRMNSYAYNLEGDLPHLVRTQRFLDELERNTERHPGESPPESIEEVAFEDVGFSYTSEEDVLREISFAVERGEFVAFVGHSGAGKSTIVSLLARMYEPHSGRITANGTDIREFDVDEWREKISIVRQDPYIFNDTLEYNLTIGNRTVSRSRLDTACEVAKVSEF